CVDAGHACGVAAAVGVVLAGELAVGGFGPGVEGLPHAVPGREGFEELPHGLAVISGSHDLASRSWACPSARARSTPSSLSSSAPLRRPMRRYFVSVMGRGLSPFQYQATSSRSCAGV